MNENFNLQDMMGQGLEPDYDNYQEIDYGDSIPDATMVNETEIVSHGAFNHSSSFQSVPIVEGSKTNIPSSAIAALMMGRPTEEARLIAETATANSMSNIPSDALAALMGGNLSEAAQKAKPLVKRRSEDDLFDTKKILEERVKNASQKPIVNESQVLGGQINEERLNQLIEERVMKVLQKISGLQESEKKQDEIMFVIGENIFAGKLRKIGKFKK